ncbi:hypothetical protein [Coraliomargarita akajimensis]|uniref:Uncharacterized protein n=1 Tax=Coraliomargarita akajimensis (strain DSM 45221 / IAM 15411 / JCM 23193 / KCTC 12865 / 04OKA010-24) TaxID=583355 RepID=D5EN13_CORAD|nr:hypothetical protein [Coraliomargarita akajimensis]ADE53448.1 hypothetical protein Caka_0423 [Coraliomargarita akajimensis DSM 45221]
MKQLTHTVLAVALLSSPGFMLEAVPKSEGSVSGQVFVAAVDFPIIDKGAVPYTKPKKGKVLSINAANPAYRDKFARAEMVYQGASGTYDITIVTLTEFDGECTYRLLIDGKPIRSFTNPRVDKSGDFKSHTHTWKAVPIIQGVKLAIESNTASNDLIPEGDGFAWARGRWSELHFAKTKATD